MSEKIKLLNEEELDKVCGGMYQRIRSTNIELDKSENNTNKTSYGRQIVIESENIDYINPWK